MFLARIKNNSQVPQSFLVVIRQNSETIVLTWLGLQATYLVSGCPSATISWRPINFQDSVELWRQSVSTLRPYRLNYKFFWTSKYGFKSKRPDTNISYLRTLYKEINWKEIDCRLRNRAANYLCIIIWHLSTIATRRRSSRRAPEITWLAGQHRTTSGSEPYRFQILFSVIFFSCWLQTSVNVSSLSRPFVRRWRQLCL